MSLIPKPNVWIDYEADPSVQLTYALQTNPSPLTVSNPKAPPRTESLEFVITNQTPIPVTVTSITFTFKIGSTGDCLTPNTDDIKTQVDSGWEVTGPTSTTGETADYILGPAVGSSVELDTGASVVLQFYEIQPVPQPGTTTIHIEEALETSSASTDVSVTTFPDGFYFNGLAATVQNGSALVPVAQVVNGDTVTLVWNASAVETTAVTIRYSDAAGGQQTVNPHDFGKWTSPPLTSDTIFTVSVAVTTTGGQPLTLAASTSVSVRNPALIAASVVTGTAGVTGNATIGGATAAKAITADSVGVNGALTAQSANLSGAVSAGSVAAGSINVSGDLKVGGQTNLSGALKAQLFSAGIKLDEVNSRLAKFVTAKTDGIAIVKTNVVGGVVAIDAYDTPFGVTSANGYNTVTVPIVANMTWGYAGDFAEVWWIPMGAGPGPSHEIVSGPTTPESLIHALPISSSSRVAERRKRAEDFIETLSRAFNAPLTDSMKVELTESLLRF